ncbi:MAG: hypothetical protein HKN38_00665 [Altererythrobacter sp.]|nr:hypothetical protein [Altererythrobacter sp.]
MAIETIYVGYSIIMPINEARCHQDNAAARADQEIRGLGAEPVPGRLNTMCNRKPAVWISQPFDLMLCTKRASALARSETLQRNIRFEAEFN